MSRPLPTAMTMEALVFWPSAFLWGSDSSWRWQNVLRVNCAQEGARGHTESVLHGGGAAHVCSCHRINGTQVSWRSTLLPNSTITGRWMCPLTRTPSRAGSSRPWAGPGPFQALLYQRSWFYAWWSSSALFLPRFPGKPGFSRDPDIFNNSLKYLGIGNCQACTTNPQYLFKYVSSSICWFTPQCLQQP